MNYCVEQQGMNEPLTIRPGQVKYEPLPETPGDINPTVTNPGLTYTNEPTPKINVTLDQPATLTVIYVPIDRLDKPSNVIDFYVKFVYPNDTTSILYTSTPARTPETTTTSGLSTPTTTTAAGTTAGVQPPSSDSPHINLPPNFRVPENTVIMIMIKSTPNNEPPTGVRIILVLLVSCLFETFS